MAWDFDGLKSDLPKQSKFWALHTKIQQSAVFLPAKHQAFKKCFLRSLADIYVWLVLTNNIFFSSLKNNNKLSDTSKTIMYKKPHLTKPPSFFLWHSIFVAILENLNLRKTSSLWFCACSTFLTRYSTLLKSWRNL